jgi:hypothetical protein
MRKILSISSNIGNYKVLACFWFAISVSAQQPDSQTSQANYPPQLLKDLSTLRDAALDSEYAYKQVAELSENIGPRMAGSPQAEYAVEHVANELRKLGLDVHLEEVKARHWVRGVESRRSSSSGIQPWVRSGRP